MVFSFYLHPGVSLFSVDPTREVGGTAQCRQEGVTNCRAVSINLEYLQDNISPGDSINFIPGVELSMKVTLIKLMIQILSYSFSSAVLLLDLLLPR